MSTETIPGGFTPYRPLTSKDKEVFTIPTNDLIGVKYTPEEVNT